MRECQWDDQQDNCEGGRFFRAADGSDVQMSESQSRGAGTHLLHANERVWLLIFLD